MNRAVRIVEVRGFGVAAAHQVVLGSHCSKLGCVGWTLTQQIGRAVDRMQLHLSYTFRNACCIGPQNYIVSFNLFSSFLCQSAGVTTSVLRFPFLLILLFPTLLWKRSNQPPEPRSSFHSLFSFHYTPSFAFIVAWSLFVKACQPWLFDSISGPLLLCVPGMKF